MRFGQASTATCRATRFSGSLAHIGCPREPTAIPSGSNLTLPPPKTGQILSLRAQLLRDIYFLAPDRGGKEEVIAFIRESAGKDGTRWRLLTRAACTVLLLDRLFPSYDQNPTPNPERQHSPLNPPPNNSLTDPPLPPLHPTLKELQAGMPV